VPEAELLLGEIGQAFKAIRSRLETVELFDRARMHFDSN